MTLQSRWASPVVAMRTVLGALCLLVPMAAWANSESVCHAMGSRTCFPSGFVFTNRGGAVGLGGVEIDGLDRFQTSTLQTISRSLGTSTVTGKVLLSSGEVSPTSDIETGQPHGVGATRLTSASRTVRMSIPEPRSIGLLGTGLLLTGMAIRRIAKQDSKTSST